MNWFKDLFKWPQDHPASELPPRMILKYTNDVSEPVLSFIETFKSNPTRFKIVFDQDYVIGKTGEKFLDWKVDYREIDQLRLRLIDKKEKLSWKFSLSGNYYIYNACRDIPFPISNYPQFLSKDEIEFVYDKMKEHFEDRNIKLMALKTVRKMRVFRKEREALKKVYCK